MSRLVEKAWNDPEPGAYEWVLDIEWDYEDQGCSCPTPFEDTTEDDLTEITKMQDFYDVVLPRIKPVIDVDTDEVSNPDPQVVDAVNQAVWTISEILNPEQRKFGAIKHAA